MRILFIGDIIGSAGRTILSMKLSELVREYAIDFTIANGENAAGGFGITPKIADEILALGVDFITTGNHIWDKREIGEYLAYSGKIIRPLNYPPGVEGKGYAIVDIGGRKIAIVNLLGRVYMGSYDCPFRAFETLLAEIGAETKTIVVDLHAETTSEKYAFAWCFDGRCSAVLGTHTHVQTADERVFPKGTAFIADVGMTGGSDSVIGMNPEEAIRKFLTQTPVRFDVARSRLMINAVVVDIDDATGRANEIIRLRVMQDR